jgi:hypothetical protein
MIKRSVTAEDAVALLNEAARLDPTALRALIETRHRCTPDLADHPTIQVGFDEEDNFCINLVGVLNGLFGIDDEGHGAIVVE